MDFSDMSVKVMHRDVSTGAVIDEGARGRGALMARREVLNHLVEGRLPVVRIGRVEERRVRADAD